MEKGGYIYITSNYKRTVFYIGVTSNIVGRIWEHKESIYENSFTKRYRVFYLVYYEQFEEIESAIDREKQLKRYKRDRKINLISAFNPGMADLYTDQFIQDHS